MIILENKQVKVKIGHKKPPNLLRGFYSFASPNIILSNHFNEELMRFALFS